MLLSSVRSRSNTLPRLPLAASDISILPSPEQFREQLLAHIASARKRIYLAALYLQEDSAGAMVLEALYAARQRNPQLEIAVLVDWHRGQRGLIGKKASSGNAAWYHREALRHPELEVPIYGVPVQTRELFGVLHLKGFIIDDLVIYSGASLNNVYLHVGDRYRYDRYHLLRCPPLADSMAEFICHQLLANPAVQRLDRQPLTPTKSLTTAIRELRKKLAKSRYQSSSSRAASDQLSVTPVVGVGKRNQLNQLILNLIASTQRQLTICTPYFNLPRAVQRQVSRLLALGVRVEIIVGDKTANDFYLPPDEPFKVIGALPYIYEANLRRFAKSHQKQLTSGQLQLRLWNDPGHSYHLKGLWIDDDRQLITGNNLNPRAFSLDLENGLLIEDPQRELLTIRNRELTAIRTHTQVISHYRQLDKVESYPPPVRKLLTRLRRIRADRLVSKLL